MNMCNAIPATGKAALEYAARGWHVFPATIKDGAKKGHVAGKNNGGERWGATTCPDTIRHYWTEWPNALLGVATGPKTGLFVVEADTPAGHDVDGIATMNALIEKHGPLPDTIEALSPSGSWHLWFKWPDGLDIRNSASAIGQGIDVRGEGGMILAPPSIRAGFDNPYRWKNPPGLFELADCPQWLLDKIELSQRPKLSERAAPTMPNTMTPAGLEELADLLDYIDPDAGGYDGWCNILMAIHDHTGGAGDGLALADQWSARGGKYKPGEVAQKWRSFKPGGGVGIGTICTAARQNGADLSAIARQHKKGKAIEIVRNEDRAATSDGTPRPNAPDEPPELNQDALALAMGAADWDENARHVASWGKWLFWTGSHWQTDDRLDHMTRTRAYLRDRAESLMIWAERKGSELTEADPVKGKQDAAKLKLWAKGQAETLRHKNTVAAIESLARSNPASVAIADDFDTDRMLLGTPPGTVDLRTGRLRGAWRHDMITKQTSTGPAEPGAVPHRWLQFLSEIFDGDQEIIDFMQRAAGYALTGQTTEHKLLFLYGTGRNGKSVFLNTLFDIWGDYARRAAAETFLNTMGDKHGTGIAGLQGARLVAGSELPKGKTWDEAVIKDLTGGDVMSGRYMRGNWFDFMPQLTLMIAGNNQPSFRGVDEAIRARVVLVPFTVTIPEEQRDKGLPDKLKAEAPAILRWAIDGALAWQKRGLDVPASIVAASTEYMDDEDTLAQFLSDETATDAQGFVTTTDLHQRFVQWSQSQGLNSWTVRTLQKEVKGRGYQEYRRNHGRGFAGIRLR